MNGSLAHSGGAANLVSKFGNRSTREEYPDSRAVQPTLSKPRLRPEQLKPIGPGRHALPALERSDERRWLRVAEASGDSLDAHAGAQQFVGELAADLLY